MDLKQLHYFVTVVEEGNISTAAKKLFMSQPPISTQLKLLEEELGCTLFRRGQRQIQLTEAGKLLYAKAAMLLELSRTTKEEIRERAEAEAGTIRIGIVSSVICPMAAEWIADFTGQYPQINFAIYEANTYDLIEKLRANILHIAVIRTPYAADDLIAEPLKSESIVAIGQKSLFPDAGQTITLESLSALPLLLYRRWEPVVRGEFEKANLPVRVKCMCDDARTAVSLAERGIGIGLVPYSIAESIADSGMVRKQLEACRIESRIDLIYRENAHLPSCAAIFRKYLSGRFPCASESEAGPSPL